MNEKQQFTIGSFERSSGFFRVHAVRRVSWAGSNAIVPNSSQYRTSDSSVRISCKAILPWAQFVNIGLTDMESTPTHISQSFDRNMDQFRHLLIPPDEFSRPPPTTSRDGHGGEYSVILGESLLKPHFHEDELHIGETLHLFTEFRSKAVQRSQNLLFRCASYVPIHIGAQTRIALDVVERFQHPGLVLSLEYALHALFWCIVARWIGCLEVEVASLIRRLDGDRLGHRASLLGIWWRHRAGLNRVRRHGMMHLVALAIAIVDASEEAGRLRLVGLVALEEQVLLVRKVHAVIDETGVQEVIEQIEFVVDFRSQHVLGIVAVHVMKLILGGQPCIREAGNFHYEISSAFPRGILARK